MKKLRAVIKFCVQRKKNCVKISSVRRKIRSLHKVLISQDQIFLNSKSTCTREKIFIRENYHCIISNAPISMEKFCKWIEETSRNLVQFLSAIALVVLELFNFFGNLLNILCIRFIFKLSGSKRVKESAKQALYGEHFSSQAQNSMQIM